MPLQMALSGKTSRSWMRPGQACDWLDFSFFVSCFDHMSKGQTTIMRSLVSVVKKKDSSAFLVDLSVYSIALFK